MSRAFGHAAHAPGRASRFVAAKDAKAGGKVQLDRFAVVHSVHVGRHEFLTSRRKQNKTLQIERGTTAK